MNRLMAVLATAMLAVPAGAAFAGDFAQDQASFRYSDLDLTSHDGNARLATRIANAADKVCGTGFDRVHPMLAQQAALCKAEVIAETRVKLDQQIAARGQAVQVAQRGMAAHATLK